MEIDSDSQAFIATSSASGDYSRWPAKMGVVYREGNPILGCVLIFSYSIYLGLFWGSNGIPLYSSFFVWIVFLVAAITILFEITDDMFIVSIGLCHGRESGHSN